MITKLPIGKALQLENAVFIDVRSPREYEHDHILGAINLPILTNEEHHEVGTIYKQISQKIAIEKGMKYYEEKIPTITNAVKEHRSKNIVVYCARGGMRSGIIASLLDSLGFKVYQIIDGYKGFRNYLIRELADFQLKPRIVMLWGLTCTGKTALLRRFPNSLDLEELAQHRGSLMGAVGLKPNSQKKFENLLLERLNELREEKYIFVEGESRRVGNCIIPEFLFKAMLGGINVKVTRSMEKRIQAMVEEYFSVPEIVDEIKNIIPQFREIISEQNKRLIVSLIEKGDYHEASRMIFEKYYDPLYEHGLKKIDYQFEVNNDKLDRAVKEIKKKVKKKIG